MKVSNLLPIAFAGVAFGQSLVEVIGGQDDLSLLGELLNNNTAILDSLQDASNITILAPTNDAISSLLSSDAVTGAEDLAGLVTAVLTYHVLNGTYFAANITETPAFVPTMLSNSSYENVTGSQVVEAVASEAEDGNTTVSFLSALKMPANVTTADVEFDGGVIHIIDSVLMIPMNLTATAIEGGLSAVVGALNMTEQASTVEELQDVTIFAPNNDAFAAIANLVGELSSDDLSKILAYHVISGTVAYSSDLTNGSVETLGGQDVDISISDDGVFVNAARVVIPDILIANGVVHVIDSVLNPNGTDSENEPNPDTTTPAFPGASTATDGGVPFTSGLPTPTETDTGLGGDDSEGGGDGGEGGGDDEGAAVRATAAVAMGVLFGGAVMLMNIV